MSDEKIDSSGGSSGGSKLVPILTIVNLVATLAMIGVVVFTFQKEKTQPSVDDIVAEDAGHGEAAHGDAAHGEAKKDDGHGGGHGVAHGGAAAKDPNVGRMVTLEQFSINLATPGSAAPKYVRANISIEVPNDEVGGELNNKMPQVRNTIIDLINSKRPSDLSSVEGRDFLKEEIRNAINGFLITGKIKGVFFTNFALAG